MGKIFSKGNANFVLVEDTEDRCLTEIFIYITDSTMQA
jgi:hypothetical protein